MEKNFLRDLFDPVDLMNPLYIAAIVALHSHITFIYTLQYREYTCTYN